MIPDFTRPLRSYCLRQPLTLTETDWDAYGFNMASMRNQVLSYHNFHFDDLLPLAPAAPQEGELPFCWTKALENTLAWFSFFSALSPPRIDIWIQTNQDTSQWGSWINQAARGGESILNKRESSSHSNVRRCTLRMPTFCITSPSSDKTSLEWVSYKCLGFHRRRTKYRT